MSARCIKVGEQNWEFRTPTLPMRHFLRLVSTDPNVRRWEPADVKITHRKGQRQESVAVGVGTGTTDSRTIAPLAWSGYEARDRKGRTPLHLFSRAPGQVELVHNVPLLLEGGSDVQVWNGDDRTPFKEAPARGWDKIVQLLWENEG